MKYISLLSLLIIISFCNAQTSTTKVQKSGTTTTTTKTTNSSVKPITNTAKKFSFIGSYTMKFTAKDVKGKVTTGEIKSAFDEFKMASIPTFSDEKETSLKTIFDFKTNTMTMLIDDLKKKKKSGMIMKIPKINTATTKTETTNTTASIQKTTEAKTIDGYKCTKWIMTYSDGAKCESWITKDITINSSEAVSYFTAGRKGKKSPINTECANIIGCALESTFTAKDGSSIFMKMTDIKKEKPNASFFSTSGYELADVTGIEFFK